MTLRNYLITVPRSSIIEVTFLDNEQRIFELHNETLLIHPMYRWIIDTELVLVTHKLSGTIHVLVCPV